SGIRENRIDQPRMIEHRIARLVVAQEIDERDAIVLRTCESPHDEVEIGGGEPRPTIRLNHREAIMSIGDAICNPLSHSKRRRRSKRMWCCAVCRPSVRLYTGSGGMAAASAPQVHD